MKDRVRDLRRFLRFVLQSLQLNANPARRSKLLGEFYSCNTVPEVISFTKKYLDTGVCQLPSEIEGALALVVAAQPRTVCEIGTATGGNLLLLSRWLADADLMLGIDLYVRNKAYLRLLRRPSQRIVLLDGSSYSKTMIERVSRILQGRKLDLLFIDGDHRYEGVKSDFLLYRHFVAEGGHILFHDIMSDQGDDWLWAGGVPDFWEEVKELYPSQEFINNPGQKGFGIGLIRYSADVALPKGFETLD